MAHHLEPVTIEQIGDTWRVCVAGMCKEHHQEWQARVFYHQMTATAAPQAHDPATNTAAS